MTLTKQSRVVFLLALQAAYVFISQIGMAVILPYFRDRFSFSLMALHIAVMHLVPVIIIPFVRNYKARAFIIIAFLIAIVTKLYATTVTTPIELIAFAVLAGLPMVFFWIPYEIMYFNNYDVRQHGKLSAWYFSIFAIVSIVVPVASGFFADRFGFYPLFYLSAALLLIPLFMSMRVSSAAFSTTLAQSLTHLKGVIGLLVFDGFFMSINMGLVALSLLKFTDKAGEFGLVVSLVAIGATIVSFFAAKISDAKGSRSMIIYPLSALIAVTLILLGLQTTLISFTVVLIIYSALRTIIQPVVNALPMDLRHDHAKLYVGRQFLINLGRVAGFVLTWFFVSIDGLLPMYLVYAGAYLIYIYFVKNALKAKQEAHFGGVMPA